MSRKNVGLSVYLDPTDPLYLYLQPFKGRPRGDTMNDELIRLARAGLAQTLQQYGAPATAPAPPSGALTVTPNQRPEPTKHHLTVTRRPGRRLNVTPAGATPPPGVSSGHTGQLNVEETPRAARIVPKETFDRRPPDRVNVNTDTGGLDPGWA